MADAFESGVLLGHIYTLADGAGVRLRLARTSDLDAITRLLAEHGIDAPSLEAARLVHFDPRRRYVVCATGLFDGSETLLGVGAIALDPAASEPYLLIVGQDRPAEVTALLDTALIATAELIGGHRAA